MQFRTQVKIPPYPFSIPPCAKMLFVGSCFAQSMGERFLAEKFRATVNPYGVMYNPASILHTVSRCQSSADFAVLTLGTNHVYRLKETDEIVDNCQKRPQSLFREEVLSIDECVGFLSQAVDTLVMRNPDIKVIITVSPIRYAKYGFHESQLSKAVLLLSANEMEKRYAGKVFYFPAYEIVNDEYFGKVPADRLQVGDGLIRFKIDGKYRSKIGLPAGSAKDICGSYDPEAGVLNILKYTIPEGECDYVNSQWGPQDDPYHGDVINSYNDGPTETGTIMGPFYEIETSSPAAPLQPGQTLTHTQYTLHLQGPAPILESIFNRIFLTKDMKLK